MKTFFTVYINDVLNSADKSGYIDYIKTVEHVHAWIEFDSDDQCTANVSCDMQYMYERVFTGAGAVKLAVAWANSRLNDKYLSNN